MYARLVATLDPCAPDIAPELMQQLKGEFRFRVSLLNTWLYLSMIYSYVVTKDIPCACTCMYVCVYCPHTDILRYHLNDLISLSLIWLYSGMVNIQSNRFWYTLAAHQAHLSPHGYFC